MVGGVGVFGAQALQQSSKTTSNNLDRNRLLTDSEKQRFKNLSAAEKKKRGIATVASTADATVTSGADRRDSTRGGSARRKI